MTEDGNGTYQLVTEDGYAISTISILCRQTLFTSNGFTGKGTATYPNNDQYKGEFVDGVSIFVNLFNSATTWQRRVHLQF